MSAILVTDGEQRSTLAAVRSLSSAGHTVIVCSAVTPSLAGASRGACEDIRVANPLAQPELFAEQVRELVNRHKIEIVIPMTEAAVLALLPARDALGARLPLPASGVFERICDKAAVMDAARAIGIGVPAEVRLISPEDAHAVNVHALPYPLVLKPARSVVGANGRRTKSAVVHAADVDELRKQLDRMRPEAYPILLQERIVGPGVGVFLLVWDGETRAAFSHRRIREKPPSGGVSVLRESIPLDPRLLELSRELLRGFGWEGVAMVEYKIDRRTNRPYIMEINGRFWGSLQLAVDAGVDFPSLLVQAMEGLPNQTRTEYQIGVRSRWWWGDVDHLIARLRQSSAELALEPGAPGRARAVVDFLTAFGPGHRNEILRWSDPRPALRETLKWIRRQ